MARERLSKLQKWILKRVYEVPEEYVMGRETIMNEFFKVIKGRFPKPNPYYAFPMLEKNPKKLNSIQASLTRSLKSLKDKGYIKLYYHSPRWTFNQFLEVPIAVGIQGSLERLKDEYAGSNFSKDTYYELDEKDEGNIKAIKLTDKGREKAKELLNVKNSQPEKLSV